MITNILLGLILFVLIIIAVFVSYKPKSKKIPINGIAIATGGINLIDK